MQYKKFVITLGDDGSEEAALNRFLRGHRVLKVEHYFMESESLWAFLVSYLDGEQKDSAPPAQRSNSERLDPSKELTQEQMARYNKYVEIRLQLARRDAVKAFVVFTNRELAEIAKVDKLNMDVLKNLSGVGEARIAQYGEDFLSMALMGTTSDGNNNEESGSFD